MTRDDAKKLLARSFSWFDAASIGSLITCGIFYLNYDQWKPLVMSALLVSGAKIAQHFVGLLNGSIDC